MDNKIPPVSKPPKPKFDSDLSPQSEYNRRIARENNLQYDPSKRAYVDAVGALIADRFGQEY